MAAFAGIVKVRLAELTVNSAIDDAEHKPISFELTFSCLHPRYALSFCLKAAFERLYEFN